MINLLPDELKENHTYARHNRQLLRWVWAMVAGLGGMVVITAAGIFYMNQSVNNLSAQVQHGQELLTSQHVDQVKKQTTDISNNLKLVVQVLSNEVLFSQLLKQVGTITPPNVVLTGLSISKTQGALDLNIASADYNAATQMQVNLQDPHNKIFSKADIITINCNSTNADPKYPCTAGIRALFTTNNPFLFINNAGVKR
jgi:Tfp pilus assembly protein PilN